MKKFYKNKKVLITGHTGFKGSWLSEILVNWGANVSGFSLEHSTEPNFSTKTAFESILKFYSQKYDLKCATLKLFTPYGPKDDEIKITPYLIINSIKKNDILIKSPTKKLDFVYVKDVVDSFIAAMNNISKLEEYNSFNMGTEVGTTLTDVLGIIEDNLGKNENVSYGNLEDDHVWCSNEKIKSMLDWEPKIKLDDGINLTINYYNQYY